MPSPEWGSSSEPEGDQIIRVLVADDHPVVREGLRSFLAARPGIEVVGEAGDADSTVTAAEAFRPDVVLVDLMMPSGSTPSGPASSTGNRPSSMADDTVPGGVRSGGIEAIRRLSAIPSAPRILVLTSFAGDDMVLPALRAGAAGYLLKDVRPADLEAAVRTVHEGGALLAPEVTARVINQATGPRTIDEQHLAELTPREREVLVLLARGLSNRDLATELYVSEKTIKTHVSSILTKLHLADRTQAALFAVRHDVTDDGTSEVPRS